MSLPTISFFDESEGGGESDLFGGTTLFGAQVDGGLVGQQPSQTTQPPPALTQPATLVAAGTPPHFLATSQKLGGARGGSSSFLAPQPAVATPGMPHSVGGSQLWPGSGGDFKQAVQPTIEAVASHGGGAPFSCQPALQPPQPAAHFGAPPARQAGLPSGDIGDLFGAGGGSFGVSDLFGDATAAPEDANGGGSNWAQTDPFSAPPAMAPAAMKGVGQTAQVGCRTSALLHAPATRVTRQTSAGWSDDPFSASATNGSARSAPVAHAPAAPLPLSKAIEPFGASGWCGKDGSETFSANEIIPLAPSDEALRAREANESARLAAEREAAEEEARWAAEEEAAARLASEQQAAEQARQAAEAARLADEQEAAEEARWAAEEAAAAQTEAARVAEQPQASEARLNSVLEAAEKEAHWAAEERAEAAAAAKVEANHNEEDVRWAIEERAEALSGIQAEADHALEELQAPEVRIEAERGAEVPHTAEARVEAQADADCALEEQHAPEAQREFERVGEEASAFAPQAEVARVVEELQAFEGISTQGPQSHEIAGVPGHLTPGIEVEGWATAAGTDAAAQPPTYDGWSEDHTAVESAGSSLFSLAPPLDQQDAVSGEDKSGMNSIVDLPSKALPTEAKNTSSTLFPPEEGGVEAAHALRAGLSGTAASSGFHSAAGLASGELMPAVISSVAEEGSDGGEVAAADPAAAWAEGETPEGYRYWYNYVTQESSWTMPSSLAAQQSRAQDHGASVAIDGSQAYTASVDGAVQEVDSAFDHCMMPASSLGHCPDPADQSAQATESSHVPSAGPFLQVLADKNDTTWQPPYADVSSGLPPPPPWEHERLSKEEADQPAGEVPPYGVNGVSGAVPAPDLGNLVTPRGEDTLEEFDSLFAESSKGVAESGLANNFPNSGSECGEPSLASAVAPATGFKVSRDLPLQPYLTFADPVIPSAPTIQSSAAAHEPAPFTSTDAEQKMVEEVALQAADEVEAARLAAERAAHEEQERLAAEAARIATEAFATQEEARRAEQAEGERLATEARQAAEAALAAVVQATAAQQEARLAEEREAAAAAGQEAALAAIQAEARAAQAARLAAEKEAEEEEMRWAAEEAAAAAAANASSNLVVGAGPPSAAVHTAIYGEEQAPAKDAVSDLFSQRLTLHASSYGEYAPAPLRTTPTGLQEVAPVGKSVDSLPVDTEPHAVASAPLSTGAQFIQFPAYDDHTQAPLSASGEHFPWFSSRQTSQEEVVLEAPLHSARESTEENLVLSSDAMLHGYSAADQTHTDYARDVNGATNMVAGIANSACNGGEGIPPHEDTHRWVQAVTEEGYPYWYNAHTGESAWELPQNLAITQEGQPTQVSLEAAEREAAEEEARWAAEEAAAAAAAQAAQQPVVDQSMVMDTSEAARVAAEKEVGEEEQRWAQQAAAEAAAAVAVSAQAEHTRNPDEPVCEMREGPTPGASVTLDNALPPDQHRCQLAPVHTGHGLQAELSHQLQAQEHPALEQDLDGAARVSFGREQPLLQQHGIERHSNEQKLPVQPAVQEAGVASHFVSSDAQAYGGQSHTSADISLGNPWLSDAADVVGTCLPAAQVASARDAPPPPVDLSGMAPDGSGAAASALLGTAADPTCAPSFDAWLADPSLRLPSLVAQHDAASMQALGEYPGPLTQDRYMAAREWLLGFTSRHADTQGRDTPGGLMWALLHLLCESDGLLDASGDDEHSERLLAAVAMCDTGNAPEASPAIPTPQKSAAQTASEMSQLEALLLQGKREAACGHAMTCGLWADALLLASHMDASTWKMVMQRYTAEQTVPGSPLATLYSLFSGSGASVLGPPAEEAARGSGAPSVPPSPHVARWAKNLAMMLANPTMDDTEVILQLGDRLRYR